MNLRVINLYIVIFFCFLIEEIWDWDKDGVVGIEECNLIYFVIMFVNILFDLVVV